MRKYYYLYEITNLTTGKKYIGQHCTHKMKDGYTGTCKELNEAIANGDKYIVKILKRFTNIFDLGDAEYEEIKKRNCIKDKTYYNKANMRFYNFNFEYGLSETYRKNVSIGTQKGMTPEVCKKVSDSQLGKSRPHKGGQVAWNKGLTKQTDKRVKGGMEGKHHSKKTKDKISDKLKGTTHPPLSQETKNKITTALIAYHKQCQKNLK